MKSAACKACSSVVFHKILLDNRIVLVVPGPYVGTRPPMIHSPAEILKLRRKAAALMKLSGASFEEATKEEYLNSLGLKKYSSKESWISLFDIGVSL